ncbi:hypothetical protein [Arthrobacter sp. UYEF3]|uniref:hypothetical protein n=1 Tax=Arthrobacter sp. UYEF3 TaxID=1756365 RepID=UPI0033982101
MMTAPANPPWAAEVECGCAITLAVSKLDLTSLGSPSNASLRAEFTDAKGVVTVLGTVPVSAGAASENVLVPVGGASAGTGTLVLTAVESGTVVKAEVKVAASAPVPPKCTAPVPPKKWYDIISWVKYAIALVRYQKCLRGYFSCPNPVSLPSPGPQQWTYSQYVHCPARREGMLIYCWRHERTCPSCTCHMHHAGRTEGMLKTR